MQYDLESTSSVVARVTATTTVTVQVKAEQRPNERTVNDQSFDNKENDIRSSDGGVTVVDLEDYADGK